MPTTITLDAAIALDRHVLIEEMRELRAGAPAVVPWGEDDALLTVVDADGDAMTAADVLDELADEPGVVDYDDGPARARAAMLEGARLS